MISNNIWNADPAGYMQEFISAPVVNDVTIRIVWVLIIFHAVQYVVDGCT
jgi:hypothetical protein